jgi:DNA replicative helicase MCM subunit Mcm2 (Cdc46/Mcm family)
MMSKREFVCEGCQEKFTAVRMRDDWKRPPKKCPACCCGGSLERVDEALKRTKARYIDRYPGSAK